MIVELRDKLTFGEALELLKRGHAVKRRGWNISELGLQAYIRIEIFDNLKVFVYYAKGESHQWHPSPEDLLAEDWVHLLLQ